MLGLLESLSDRSALLLGIGASLVASLGTGLGALPILAITTVSRKAQDVLLAGAAGVMLAATAFSLVAPGLAAAEARGMGGAAGAALIGASIFLGALAVLLVHRRAPHEHFVSGREGPASPRLRRAWLFVIAIALHNFPEGLAVGVGFGGEVANGAALTAAIFLQNLPEGFVVALALVAIGYRRTTALLVAGATGLVEMVGGIAGASAVVVAGAALPWSMGFAAGAMLFVVSHEIIPETHRNGHEVEATFGVVGGFVVMLLLAALLG